MSCCGQRRKAHRAWLESRPVRMLFVGEGRVEAKGKVTGRSYVVSESAREIEVDARDARNFLEGGRFAVVRDGES